MNLEAELKRLWKLEDNKVCADCADKNTFHVDLTHYVFICSRCAVIHRAYQFKVKSISMSEFSQEEIAMIASVGNSVSNSFYLARVNDYPKSPDDFSNQNVFIRLKYIDKKWIDVGDGLRSGQYGRVNFDSMKLNINIRRKPSNSAANRRINVDSELKRICTLDGNNICANCPQKSYYVDLTHNIFLCTRCAGIHRDFQFKVKGIGMSIFSDLEVSMIGSVGNDPSNAMYLANLAGYLFPDGNDINKLKDFIRCKYIDKRWFAFPDSAITENLSGLNAEDPFVNKSVRIFNNHNNNSSSSIPNPNYDIKSLKAVADKTISSQQKLLLTAQDTMRQIALDKISLEQFVRGSIKVTNESSQRLRATLMEVDQLSNQLVMLRSHLNIEHTKYVTTTDELQLNANAHKKFLLDSIEDLQRQLLATNVECSDRMSKLSETQTIVSQIQHKSSSLVRQQTSLQQSVDDLTSDIAALKQIHDNAVVEKDHACRLLGAINTNIALNQFTVKSERYFQANKQIEVYDLIKKVSMLKNEKSQLLRNIENIYETSDVERNIIVDNNNIIDT